MPEEKTLSTRLDCQKAMILNNQHFPLLTNFLVFTQLLQISEVFTMDSFQLYQLWLFIQ